MIRPLNKRIEKEKEDIISVWYDAAISRFNFLPLDYFSRESKVLRDNLNLHDTLICEYNNQILGYISMIDTEYISYIYVDPMYQNKRIGTSLIDILKEQKNVLKVKVFKEAKISVVFFLSKGFKFIDEKIDTNTNQTICYMEWTKGVNNGKVFNN